MRDSLEEGLLGLRSGRVTDFCCGGCCGVNFFVLFGWYCGGMGLDRVRIALASGLVGLWWGRWSFLMGSGGL